MGLTWAHGVVPVPGGSIHVSWNATNDVVNRIEIIAPRGTTGSIQLPVTNGSCSTSGHLDGQAVAGKSGIFRAEGGDKLVLVLA